MLTDQQIKISNNKEDQGIPIYLLIKTSTWQKTTTNLYHYQYNNYYSKNQTAFYLKEGFIYIYRHPQNSQVKYLFSSCLGYTHIEDFQLLVCIQVRNIFDKYKAFYFSAAEVAQIDKKTTIANQNRQQNRQKAKLYTNEKVYYVIKGKKYQNQQYQGYALKNQNVLKLGNTQYLIKNQVQVMRNNIKYLRKSLKQKIGKEYDNIECIFCFDNESQQEFDYFINVCQCRGSCSYVHFFCLKRWSQMKIKKSSFNSSCLSLTFQNFLCQICKVTYSSEFQNLIIKQQLMSEGRSTQNFIVLEDLTIGKDKNIHMIKNLPTNSKVSIGRLGCQVKSEDDRMSRVHASITNKSGKYIIKDNNSSYGTLVRSKRLELIITSNEKTVQIGKTIISIMMNESE